MSAMHKLLYQRIIFCNKCRRSMFVGPNARYLIHLARHTAVNRLLIFVAVLGLISFAPSTISIMSGRKVGLANFVSEEQLKQERIVQATLAETLRNQTRTNQSAYQDYRPARSDQEAGSQTDCLNHCCGIAWESNRDLRSEVGWIDAGPRSNLGRSDRFYRAKSV